MPSPEESCDSDAIAFAIAGEEAILQLRSRCLHHFQRRISTGEGGWAKKTPKRHHCYREWGMKPTLMPGKEPTPAVSVAIITGIVGGKNHQKYAGRKIIPIFFTFFIPMAGSV